MNTRAGRRRSDESAGYSRDPLTRGARSGPSFLRRGTYGETFDDVLLILFALAVAGLPFLFGSNDLATWGLNAALFGSILVLFEAGVVARGGTRPVAARHVAWAAVIFVGLAGWIVFQVSSWAPSGWDSAFWEPTREVLARVPDAGPVTGRISATPDEGVLGLVRLLTCAAAFYLALQLCRDTLRAHLFIVAFAVAAVGYAVYGILQVRFFPDTMLWVEKTHYRDAVTSTFVNRNSYATYAGMGLVAIVGLLLGVAQRASRGRHQPIALRVAAFVEAMIRRGLVLVLAMMVVTVALLGTGSRAGIVASLLGVITLLVATVALGRQRIVSIAILSVAGAVIAALVLSFGGLFADRLADSGDVGVRLSVARRAFEAARDAPWTGFGYGSFDRVFAVYRDPNDLMDSILFHWDKAHNSYVELLFDLGLPATLAVALLLGGLLVQMIRNALGRETLPMVSLITLAASALVLAHATLDFSLQIQAVTLTFAALLGAGLAQSWSRRLDTSR